LLPLGGAGPIHAAALAAELGIGRIVVPPHPGVLSAAGLLAAPIEHELAAAFPRPLAELAWSEAREALAALDAGCARLMQGEGIIPGSATARHFADVCYIGQGYHLEIPLYSGDSSDDPPDGSEPLAALYRDFLAAHDRVYGYAAKSPARIVNLRAVHRVALPAPSRAASIPSGAVRPVSTRRVLIDPAIGVEDAAIYQRAGLVAGQEFCGPAVVEQADTTTLIPSGWRCRVAAGGTLLLEPAIRAS
jgi:N-methylhydantoinase A/oxoprolinase/acetone carboxylase beta subunit